MSPLVSVIIPAYRCSKTLESSVCSALSQTVSDIETIVVNDSPDRESDVILKRLARKDQRLRVIRLKTNIGVAEARNRGVAAAKAEWIAFLDSDDLWEPDKLKKQLSAAERAGGQLIYTAAACIDETGKPTGKVFSVPETVTADGVLAGSDIVTSTVLVKHEVYLRNPMERSDLHEDLISWYGMLKNGAKAVGINEPLVRYRISGGSKSGNKLRSARMTWRSYRYLGVGFFKRVKSFLGYCIHGVKRYWL